MTNDYSNDCIEILKLLKKRRNVLLSGSPGTGKSRLLGEVARAFMDAPVTSVSAATPVVIPTSPIPIPRNATVSDPLFQTIWPAEERSNREVFRTVFHQYTKPREFISGLAPRVNGENGFRTVSGKLYHASEHAKLSDGAALLIIDEINRGPAVQIFGGSIAAIEPEKRLDDNNDRTIDTQVFEILDPESGDLIEYALPKHLYILAAMNQADTSVEPLDVAFLRRWAPYKLNPQADILREFYSIEQNDLLPSTPTTAKDVYEAAVQAWEAINERIRYGRGKEYRIGHGVFLTVRENPATDVETALEEVSEIWGYIQEHIEEVFFGDIIGLAAVLNVSPGNASHPFKLDEITFGGEPRLDLKAPPRIDSENIYGLLISVAEN